MQRGEDECSCRNEAVGKVVGAVEDADPWGHQNFLQLCPTSLSFVKPSSPTRSPHPLQSHKLLISPPALQSPQICSSPTRSLCPHQLKLPLTPPAPQNPHVTSGPTKPPHPLQPQKLCVPSSLSSPHPLQPHKLLTCPSALQSSQIPSSPTRPLYPLQPHKHPTSPALPHAGEREIRGISLFPSQS